MEQMQNENSWLEGRISVEAAIRGTNRTINGIYLLSGKQDRGLRRLRRLAESAQIPVYEVGDQFFLDNAGGRSHGGIMASAGPLCFSALEELVAGEEYPFVVMLDGIEDPFNFGQAIRALYAAGVNGLVVRPRNWLSATAVVARSSAGASELMPTAVAHTALQAAEQFRSMGLAIACTVRESATPLFQADLTAPTFLLIGGEKRGITRSFLDQADLKLQIPYGRSFAHSLGAAASTAVVAFEVFRQRSAG
jgi:23S rRNA (guanosine2251-2'-O)-methyltransferase